MNRSKENPSSARLLMRVEKSLRLILNTRLWPSMNVERPGDKDIRFIAPSLEREGELASYRVRVSIVCLDATEYILITIIVIMLYQYV